MSLGISCIFKWKNKFSEWWHWNLFSCWKLFLKLIKYLFFYNHHWWIFFPHFCFLTDQKTRSCPPWGHGFRATWSAHRNASTVDRNLKKSSEWITHNLIIFNYDRGCFTQHTFVCLCSGLDLLSFQSNWSGRLCFYIVYSGFTTCILFLRRKSVSTLGSCFYEQEVIETSCSGHVWRIEFYCHNLEQCNF